MGRPHRIVIADPLGIITGCHVRHPRLADGRSNRLDHRHVDCSGDTGAGTSSQRRDHRPRSGHACARIADGDPGLGRGPTLVAGRGIETRQGPARRAIRHVPGTRSRLSITAQRGHDDVGIDRSQLFDAETQVGHGAHAEVVDHNVARAYELFDDLAPTRVAHVHTKTEFVGVIDLEGS